MCTASEARVRSPRSRTCCAPSSSAHPTIEWTGVPPPLDRPIEISAHSYKIRNRFVDRLTEQEASTERIIDVAVVVFFFQEQVAQPVRGGGPILPPPPPTGHPVVGSLQGNSRPSQLFNHSSNSLIGGPLIPPPPPTGHPVVGSLQGNSRPSHLFNHSSNSFIDLSSRHRRSGRGGISSSGLPSGCFQCRSEKGEADCKVIQRPHYDPPCDPPNCCCC
eukprot:1178324-Prorocentrum_minimum.AAC.1